MSKKSVRDLKPTNIMKEKIYIKTNRLGFIPQIRAQGPIVTPIPVTREAAKAMVVAGIETFQVDPNTKAVSLLTLQNVYPGEGDVPVEDTNKGQGEQKTSHPTSGVAQQKPVQPVSLKGVPINLDMDEEDESSDTGATPEKEEKKDNKSKYNMYKK